MLDQFFSAPHVLTRLRGGPLGEDLDAMACYLHNRGYSPNVARAYLCVAGHFSHWLRLEQVSAGTVDEAMVVRFVEKHLPECRCSVPQGSRCHLRSALGRLLVVLRVRGCVPAQQATTPSHVDTLVEEFDVHLTDNCGATNSTRRLYTRYAREFLDAKYGDSPVTLATLQPSEVVEFVMGKAPHCKPATLHVVRTALRSFFRFAQLHALCDGDLASVVPTVAHWRLASLPKGLTEEQLDALLDSFDLCTRTGLRDFAMTLCLAQLGLRASDVAKLTLDDIDWRSGTLRIIIDKERRATVLPLPDTIGRAIVEYLRRGRPRTQDRHVFVRHALPLGRPIDAGVVTAAVRRAFRRAQLLTMSRGAHTLRHTAATRMVRAGASLKQVADILRHRSLNTVMIYAKVDLPRLAEVALPWPQVQP